MAISIKNRVYQGRQIQKDEGDARQRIKRAEFDQSMLDILYIMVDRPLMELLSRVAVHHYAEYPRGPIYGGTDGKQRWKRERRAIIDAIIEGDAERAWFEANRRRRDIMRQLGAAI